MKLPKNSKGKRSAAAGLVAVFGLVSLFADVTYEGARAIIGPYLALLGASSLAVGASSGLGEFFGYSLRLLTGLLADRTRRYWAWTFLGYALNLGAVPALALAGSWEWAAALVVLERVGKAVRTPARDALLSQATEQLGHGRGFGLHELLDQIGAVCGPLLVAAILSGQGSMRAAFLLLGIPALAALACLAWAYLRFPSSQPQLSQATGAQPTLSMSWLMAFVALHVAGLAPFPLMAFHCQQQGIFAAATVPLLFALAMGLDGILALPAGLLFDRWGLRSLGTAAVVGLLVVPLAFHHQPLAVALGIALWGAVTALQETVLKAAIAATAPRGRRALAFGAFHFVSGLAWLAAGTLFGALYRFGYLAMVSASLALQLAALAMLALAVRGQRPKAEASSRLRS